ncbi:hypothetical protein [Embleya sp. NBC_00896]|uniref:hypothetical protein n=1 Tax=Embleya sp. NBC_00896 TaxID=2975961 RepID=UPI00386760C3|nr:hypothetical protein OG928_43620 [Embleya sp. NBC_00896]
MAAVLARVDNRMRDAILARPPSPGEALTSFVLSRGSVADRAALARNPHAAPDVLLRLGRIIDPHVGAGLYRNPRVTRETAVLVLTASELDPNLREELTTTDDQRLLYPLVESHDHELVAHALARIDGRPRFPAAASVVSRGCLNLWRTTGRESARAAPANVTDLLRDRLAVTREALDRDDGQQRLDRLIQRDGRTRVVLRRLRELSKISLYHDPLPGHVQDARLVLAAPHEPLRWDVVRREHATSPLPDHALVALADLADCPANLAAAADEVHARGPVPNRGRCRSRARELLGTPLSAGAPLRELRDAYRRRAVDAAHIVTQGSPAIHALAAFEDSTGPKLEQARSAVAELTTQTLGFHVEAWTVALTLLDDFSGTLPQLLTTASSVTA